MHVRKVSLYCVVGISYASALLTGVESVTGSGVRIKFSWGCFIQWHMVVICIWCALFVTLQFYVIFMFPHQRFCEVCWHNRRILLHAVPIFHVIALNVNYQRYKREYRSKIHSTLRHSNS